MSKHENNSHSEWEGFGGKDTALMFIAGLAIALEKSKPSFKHGSKMNKSNIADAAVKVINDYGHGTEITPRALTSLITQALDKFAPKVTDD